jgi:mRNA-degrading endonuclease RelE of RelBE toxin-antitoxin system
MTGFLVAIDPEFGAEIARIQRAGHRAAADRILGALKRLVEDPVTRRPGADIRRIGRFWGHEYRLRVGDYYVIFEVDIRERTVIVTTLFRRALRRF